MSYVVLDFETYYDKDYSLRKMTPVEYILDPRFDVIGCAFKHSDGTKPFWLDAPTLEGYLPGLARRGPLTVVSHNALFDMCILAWKYGVVPHLIIDTMAMSRALLYAFVGKVSLEAIADHLKLPPKGTAIKHVSGMNADAIKSAGLWDTYTAYAIHDAWLCEQIFLKLAAQFPKDEYAIHDMVVKCAVVPKFKLDADLLAMHASYIEAQKQGLLARCGLADRMSLMSNEKFAEALRTLGVEPPTKPSPATGLTTYAFAKSDPGMIELAEHENENVQALVAARVGHKSTIEQTRTEKLLRIAQLEWPDYSTGWCPIPLRYSGAHTHRLSGDWGMNAQNWPRYTFYDDRPKETGLLRRAHCAPPGCQVVKRDASQIEARVVAWLAEQDDLLQAFAQGRDVYCEFGTRVEGRTITKADVDERFMYKTAVLGLGFGVGPDKYIKETAAKSFVTLGHSIKLDVTQGGNIVTAYRNTYHRIPAAWRTLNEAIPTLARSEGSWFGPVKLEKQAVLLPNGLRLFYHDLHYDNQRQEWMFKYGRMPKKLYGGKLFENIVQALARIITMNAALKMRRCYPQIGLAHQVHDDLVYVVPDDRVEGFDACLAACMNEPPDWAEGLPLASEGGIGPNYGDAK
jgi:DNA polymerase III epsilon subunit-like protein